MAPISVSLNNTALVPELASLHAATPTPEECERRLAQQSPPLYDVPGSYPPASCHSPVTCLPSACGHAANNGCADYSSCATPINSVNSHSGFIDGPDCVQMIEDVHGDRLNPRFPSPVPPREGASTPYPMPLLAERSPPPVGPFTPTGLQHQNSGHVDINPLAAGRTTPLPHVIFGHSTANRNAHMNGNSDSTQRTPKHVQLNPADIPLPPTPSIVSSFTPSLSPLNVLSRFTSAYASRTGKLPSNGYDHHILEQMHTSRRSPALWRAPAYPSLSNSHPALSRDSRTFTNEGDAAGAGAEIQYEANRQSEARLSPANWSTTSPDNFSLVHLPSRTHRNDGRRNGLVMYNPTSVLVSDSRPISPSLLRDGADDDELVYSIGTAAVVNVSPRQGARSISRDDSSGQWVPMDRNPSLESMRPSASGSGSRDGNPYVYRAIPSATQSPADSQTSLNSRGSRFRERLSLDGPATRQASASRQGGQEVPETRQPTSLKRKTINIGDGVRVKVEVKDTEAELTGLEKWKHKMKKWKKKFYKKMRKMCGKDKPPRGMARNF